MKILLHLHNTQDPDLKSVEFTNLKMGFLHLFALISDCMSLKIIEIMLGVNIIDGAFIAKKNTPL